MNCATPEETSIRAAQALEDEILLHGADNIMAFISEPVVGAAAPGVHHKPIYFEMVRKICDKYDILWIDNEVMAGCGRTGKKMAIENYGAVTPDIICTAKGMSCGYTPMGATVASTKIFEAIMLNGSGSFVHGHTYAGNPLSTGIAWKVMSIIERENYIDNAAKQGDYLMDKLQRLYKYPIVGNIRGKGLMIGIEFVKNKATKEPFDVAYNLKGKITDYCLEEGMVPYPGGGSVDGIRGDHILIAPPINTKQEEIDIIFEALEKSIQRACNGL